MNRKTRRAKKFTRGGEKPVNVTGRQVFGGFVPFADPSAQTADGWTVLAYEVAMKGSEVALSRRDFEDCVRNFSAYPCSPVTIEHADTDANPFAPPPREWREPNGHIEALRVGSMVRAGKTVATLEGKPSYLEPTATDVKNKKWRYGSITIIQNAVSEETAQEIGSMLWSWSLTAHPRLTGLPAIAASQKIPAESGGKIVQAGYWWGDIDTREDLIGCLREILDLPVTTTEADVLVELDKLEALAGGEGDAAGIDVDHIVGQLRDALRLPVLTTTADVMAEVRKGLTTLPSETTDTTLSHRGAAARNTTEKPTMFKFLPFAALLGIVAATEEEAEKKVTTFAQLGADAIKALGLSLTCTAPELAARVQALTTAAAKVPALETELATFRDERAKAEKALRAAWIEDVIAVKPDAVDSVLAELGKVEDNNDVERVTVTLVAGLPAAKYENALPAGSPVVRVMSNMPLLVNEAMSALSAGRYATEEQVAAVSNLLSSVGQVMVVPESLMDAVTAISGSGPAYVFLLAESMIDAGVALGLTRAQAAVLARQTVRGAGAMLTESGMTSTDLRAAVTSPGGTTAAAITELERGGLRAAMYSATAAAAAKSAKLSRRSELEGSTGNGGDARD